ncbi:MAG: DUF5655 domain-containing protein [Eubacteriales bacterium]|nr:DUF5655 domain-containing protein [Eubacteriales bacterium]
MSAFTELDILHFFEKMPDVFPIYQALEDAICAAFDPVEITVQKTQIAFSNRRRFAFASLPVRRLKGWPAVCLVVTFGLTYRLDSPRVAQAVEPCPNRWTHHVLLTDPAQADAELLGWLAASYALSAAKR